MALESAALTFPSYSEEVTVVYDPADKMFHLLTPSQSLGAVFGGVLQPLEPDVVEVEALPAEDPLYA
ncbi:hypothetical protein ACWEQ4_01340 [Rhodococcus sp. NPDC003994]